MASKTTKKKSTTRIPVYKYTVFKYAGFPVFVAIPKDEPQEYVDKVIKNLKEQLEK